MTVSIEMHENIAVIAIDDGGKNVINHEVLKGLETAFDEAENNGAGAIALKGREGCFCAGYDLAVRMGDDPEASARLGKRGGRLARRIYGSTLPVVGLSEGHALTIGALWLACCDFCIGETGTFKYVMKEVALNVPLTDWVLGPLRDKLDTRHHASALLHSMVYSPEGALEAGFVDQLVPAGEGLGNALQKAATLAELPAPAYRQTKLAMRKTNLEAMDAFLDD